MHEVVLCPCTRCDSRLRLVTRRRTEHVLTGDADEPPWHELVDLFDDTWYIDCDVDVAMGRVYDRQVAALNAVV
jgi:hypothetical protein